MSPQRVFESAPKLRPIRLGYSRVTSVFAMVGLGIGLLSIPVASSNAAEGDSVNITGLNISAVADSGGTLSNNHVVSLKGTFTNTSSQTISKLELNLVSTPSIKSRGELAELLADPTSATELIPSDISAILRNIAPGVSKNWQITFRGEQVLGDNASGVYGFGVKPDLATANKATVITTPWFFNSDIKPTNVSLVIPLTTLNTHLANDEITDQKKDLAEAKRLTNLIINQDPTKVSWLQDSALLPWLDQLEKVADSDVPEKLRAALSGLAPTTAMLPYGHADLTALVRADQQDGLADAINQTRLLSGDRQVFYAPAQGIADRETVSLLNQQGVRSIVSNDFLRGNERETTSAVVTSASNPVLVHDLGASSCLTTADKDDASFFAAITCIKSEIGMMTAESPQSARTVIVLAPTKWKISNERLSALLSVLSDHNWMQLTTLDLVAATAPTENYVATQSADSADFSRALVRQAQNLKVNTESVSALYDDQELAAGFTAARILGYSELWPSNARATEYLTENISLLNEYLNAVSIQASGRITTPEENSEIPITIVNESDSAVSVSIDLTSTATSRFSAQPTGVIQVDSGQRITVPVAITLVGAGVVDVQAQLIAPNGERFGEVENIQISSAAYSQFARTLVWGAFGLLVLLALSNFVKRRKDQRSIETAR
ncbi:MAG: DUF6049 family protein [Actinobacteria bacterium]|nr:DUF6049 family protein [Actinomycetota bacterium]